MTSTRCTTGATSTSRRPDRVLQHLLERVPFYEMGVRDETGEYMPTSSTCKT